MMMMMMMMMITMIMMEERGDDDNDDDTRDKDEYVICFCTRCNMLPVIKDRACLLLKLSKQKCVLS